MYVLKNDSLKYYPLAETTLGFTDIKMDNNGNVWLSTPGEGIWQGRFTTDGGLEIEQKWTTKNGLHSNTFLAVHIDKNNRPWMASISGICYIDNGQTNCFTEVDGWNAINSQQLRMLETVDGKLWTVGYTGLSAIPLYDLPLNVLSPQPLITEVQLFDGKADIFQYANGTSEYGLPQQLELPYHQNLLRFHFAASSQVHPSKNQFRYQLEGIDADWQYAQETRNIAYPNLPYGDYTFKLLATNNDGKWSEKPATFTFTIHPPWWRTNWAYVLYICLIISVLEMARRQVVQREKLKSRLAVEQLEKEKVQEIDQLRTRFFANISHEFRTPLTLIKAPLEDLLDSKPNDTERRIFMLMHQNTERLLQLVNQLLDLAKLEAGSLQLEPKAGDVFYFLKQLAGHFQSLAVQKELTFTIDIPSAEHIVNYDADKLEKIVINLLSNAFKFVPQGGWVMIKAKKAPDFNIEIGNSGDPIPTEEQAKIFHRFYQSDDARHQGSGVGLALVRELVELHDGTISVKSDANGTWFSVVLPPFEVADVEELAMPINTEKTVLSIDNEEIVNGSCATSGDLPLLLLTEDQAEVRAYIKSKLEKHFQIIEAENGAEGLSLAIEKLPDLIISDVMMPKMDGVSFCAAVKKDHRTDHIPVVLLTAKADIESKLTGLKTGADDYLAKPFNSQELLLRSQNLIEQRRKLQQHFSNEIQTIIPALEIDSAEQKFVKKAVAIIEKNLDNEKFSATDFAEAMLLSRAQLHRKLKSITNHSATDFVRHLRLEKAAQLLNAESDSVTQIAYQVGFNNLSYFAKCFREKYDCSPSDYITNKKRNNNTYVAK